LIYVAQLSYNL